MRNYSLLVICAIHGASPAFEFTAETDNEAVDQARAHHIDPASELVSVTPPDEGGDYEIVVSCLDSVTVPSPGGGTEVRPPGEISRFTCTHPPAPHVAEQVYAQRAVEAAEKAKAEEREATKAELLAELTAEHPELAEYFAAKAAAKGETK